MKFIDIFLAGCLAICLIFSGCGKEETPNKDNPTPVKPTPSQIIAVSSVSVDKSSVTLKVGQTVTLNATVSPSDASDKTVSWTVSDNAVVSVSAGLVKALSVGKTTVTAKAGDFSASCAVTVEDTASGDIEGTEVEDVDI